jgi:hypothetical protein
MMYLIKRKPEVSREELVVHWFANHMPAVIAGQEHLRELGRSHASRYIATLFDADRDGVHRWDGVAQLWWDRLLPRPEVAHGTEPTDTFQQKAEPYVPWATTEYVIMDGQLPVEPLTLNAPFPSTRSGFLKISFLVAAQTGADYAEFFAHWLNVHVPNVLEVMQAVGGTRYVVSHSIEPGHEPFSGMAELYFEDPSLWSAYRERIQPDGMERWVDPERTLVLRGQTEMIGIP